MRILILHRIPYCKVEYHRGVDHDEHDVSYFGTQGALDSIPRELRCRRIVRPGTATVAQEAQDWLAGRAEAFDRVISLSEYELLDAARLRELFDVPGARLDQVLLARDKVLMKQAVADAGLRVPRFLPLADFLAGGGWVPWAGQTVLKPHMGASSEGVVVFDGSAQAYAAITSRTTGVAGLDAGDAPVTDLEVEEFVEGEILHFDGLVEGGDVLVLTASEYVGTCLGYAQGQPMGSLQITLTDDERKWVSEALRAVRITDGSFHLEAIASSGELVFLEVGNRVGGADVVATFELATGIHMPSWELRILLGEAVGGRLPAAAASAVSYGWFVVPGHHLPGTSFVGFEDTRSFRTRPEVIKWTELRAGAPKPRHITYQPGEALLAGTIGAADAPTARKWMTDLFATLRLREGCATNDGDPE